jgi:hypothetical protein
LLEQLNSLGQTAVYFAVQGARGHGPRVFAMGTLFFPTPHRWKQPVLRPRLQAP